jgi:phosphoribosylaminoimidazole-succinocarboxamide synthase
MVRALAVRGYMTGSTSTSIWTQYARGVRAYCGATLPEGLRKNDVLRAPLVTPTTKAEDHDELISPAEARGAACCACAACCAAVPVLCVVAHTQFSFHSLQIVSRGLMTQAQWDAVSSRALALFAFGQAAAAARGLLLVDTKYEFGMDAAGNILLIDEIHTPDSSRYWVASTYEARHGAGQEPENIDKEFLRLWFASRCDPYADKVLPSAPPELVSELSRRYVLLYETITGQRFVPPPAGEDAPARMRADTAAALAALRAPGGVLHAKK